MRKTDLTAPQSVRRLLETSDRDFFKSEEVWEDYEDIPFEVSSELWKVKVHQLNKEKLKRTVGALTIRTIRNAPRCAAQNERTELWAWCNQIRMATAKPFSVYAFI